MPRDERAEMVIEFEQKRKMIKRLKSRPRDFTFNEIEALLLSLGFEKDNKGKTSGSKVSFISKNCKINLHKPHPHNELKLYQIDELIKFLKSEELI